MKIEGLVDQARKGAAGAFPSSPIGDFIREQRLAAQVSVRQLAKLTGVSNPYLSQIERGLRKPSAEILQQIAHGLQISAEQLYARAGLLEHRAGAAGSDVTAAILADVSLSERHKHVLIEIYQSFLGVERRRRRAPRIPLPHAPTEHKE